MRPYFAILRDSLREALASRTLQVLLGLITLLLCLVAIPGVRVELESTIQPDDILTPDALVSQLGRTQRGRNQAAWTAVQDRLSQGLRDQISDYRADASIENRDRATGQLVAELNGLIDGPALFEAVAWQDVSLNKAGNDLLAEDWNELDRDEQRRLNRLLLDGLMVGQLAAAPQPQSYFNYIFDETPFDLPGGAARSIVKAILYLVLKWLVGAVGVMAAIIFTANIIPQMFEPGEIDLLLSKPVSRSALFLTKFLGGCLFILLSAALLVTGLWMILWLRHDIWQPQILLSIPVFLLAFMVYFSISAYVGMKWRNAILAIALAIVAWLLTSGLHQTWFWGNQFLAGQRPEAVLHVGGDIVVAKRNGEVLRWDGSDWSPWLEEPGLDPNLQMQRNLGQFYPFIGPVVAGTAEQPVLVAAEALFMPGVEFRSIGQIVVGRGAEQWRRDPIGAAPQDIERLLVEPDGGVLIATRSGLSRLSVTSGPHANGDPATEPAAPADDGNVPSVDPPDARANAAEEEFPAIPFNPFQPATGGALPTTDVTVGDVSWPAPFDATIDRSTGAVAVYSRGRVVRLTPRDREYVVAAERVTAGIGAALVAINGPHLLLARQDGTIEKYDSTTLEPQGTLGQLGAAPRLLQSSPTGDRTLVLDHERTLRIVDAGTGSITTADVWGQGEITAAGWEPDGSLLVGDRYPRVIRYSPDGSTGTTAEHNTNMTWSFIWVVGPLRKLFPKPDELDLVVKELAGAGEEEQRTAADDLTRGRQDVDIWTPVWTNLAFVAVVLAWTCWVIERRDY
ncbi:MAG: ABC transporter permease [Planctomycetaceae bacterium]